MVKTKNKDTRHIILKAIVRHPEGITIPELAKITGISYQLINNILKKEDLGKFFTESHKTTKKTSTGYREALVFKISGNQIYDEDQLEDFLEAYYENYNEGPP